MRQEESKMKRNTIFLSAIAGTLLLTACGGGSVGRQADNAIVSDTDETENGMAGTERNVAAGETENCALPDERTEQTEENAVQEAGFPGEGAEQVDRGQEENATQGDQDTDAELEVKPEQGGPETDGSPKEAPRLPETGGQLMDFVPDGWELFDSVELDFNEDGISDYVGVLQAVMEDEEGGQTYLLQYPRVLFAIVGEGKAGYRLNFQDMNVIRKRDEGGVYGDPYQPLTAEGTSFTTHTYGGSAWRWCEDYTYSYREGTWWLTSSEEAYGYGDYITDYEKNDWESGVGIRKERSDDWGPMEENFALSENGGWESVGYDLEYEVPLDAQMTLEQAGKRWWLAPDRVTDWEVKEKIIAEDVTDPEDMTELPGEAYIYYNDENRVLYICHSGAGTDRDFYYLVMYDLQDQILSVLAQEESEIQYPRFYDGKIYYTTEIVEDVTYRTEEDGKEQITKEADAVGVRLNRMEPDGTGKEVIFAYRCLETVPGIMESRLPYVSMPYELNGGEIVAEVYVGGEPHPFYRMKTDGSGRERIGQVPK